MENSETIRRLEAVEEDVQDLRNWKHQQFLPLFFKAQADILDTDRRLNEHLVDTAPLKARQAIIAEKVETLHEIVIGKSGDGLVSDIRLLKREVEAGRADMRSALAGIETLKLVIVGDGTDTHPGLLMAQEKARKTQEHKRVRRDTLKQVGAITLSFILGGLAAFASATQVMDWITRVMGH